MTTYFINSLEARWTLCWMCWRTQCQLIFIGPGHSQADPSFYAITELSSWSSGAVWWFAWIQQMCTIHMKCWLLILHCQYWWKPGIMFLGDSSVTLVTWQSVKDYEGSRRCNEFRYSFSWFNYLAMKSLGRFATDFSMVRISEVRLQISGTGKCVCGNQQS